MHIQHHNLNPIKCSCSAFSFPNNVLFNHHFHKTHWWICQKAKSAIKIQALTLKLTTQFGKGKQLFQVHKSTLSYYIYMLTSMQHNFVYYQRSRDSHSLLVQKQNSLTIVKFLIQHKIESFFTNFCPKDQCLSH